MHRITERVENQLSTIEDYESDYNTLLERDELMSVGIENFNTYSEKFNPKLITVSIPTYDNLEAGREGLGSLLKGVKDKLLELIRSVMRTLSLMFAKATSLTNMMKKGLEKLETQIEGDVVFDKDNRVDYNKLNELNFLDGKSVEKSMIANIENIEQSYNESLGTLLKSVDKMVSQQISWLEEHTKFSLSILKVIEFSSLVKELKDKTSGRYGTPLKAILDKKFKGSKYKFVHYSLFKTSKEIRLLLLDFKKCNRDDVEIKLKPVCTKLKVVDNDAKVIINRNNPMDTLEEKKLEKLIKLAIQSMNDYDPVDIEKAIGSRIEDVHKQIKNTKATNKRAISNLTVIVKYYALLMKYSTTYIFNQHRMNYKSLKFLVHLSGE